LFPWVYEREFIGLLVSANKTTSGRMMGCYILCSEILVEADRLTVEVEGIDNKSKVEGVRPGKVEAEDIDNKSNKSTDKRSTGRCVATN
jgi:hypothetical protein